MTADGLRAALEGARREWERSLGNEPIDEDCLRFDAIFERAVRSWLREKAGEELGLTIGSACQDWRTGPDGADPEEVEHFMAALSPLFAALRERAEEAENGVAKLSETVRVRDEALVTLGKHLERFRGEVASLRARAEDAEARAEAADSQVEKSGKAAYEQGYDEGYWAGRRDADGGLP